MAKTYQIKGTIEYAKIFAENMDTYEKHMEKSGGAFTCNFYPEDEGFKDVLIEQDGFPAVVLGHPTFREGNGEYEFGEYMKLKRPNKGPFKNKDGVDVYGGPPPVYDFTDGPSKKLWDFEEQGEIGNGSKVIANIQFWRGKGGTKGLRLIEIAILEHVEYENSEPVSLVG